MLQLAHCCYAPYCCLLLLLLLHQQQQQRQQQAAQALTVIIDGATTSEWATRDHYKRIVEQQQRQQQQHQLMRLPTSGAAAAAAAAAANQPLADHQQLRHQQQQEEAYQQAESVGDEEAWRALERLASAGDRQPLMDQADQAQANNGAPLEEQPAGSGLGELQQPLRPAQPRIRGRESQLRKYCGYKLMDVLELVCQGRYYGGQPEVVEPSVKSRRSSRSRALHQSPAAQGLPLLDDDQLQQVVAPEQTAGQPRRAPSRKLLYRRIREEALWRGVTKECCDNPCRMEDLKNYCQPT